MEELLKMSHTYGADPRFVLAGGGNTSLKTETTLFIKGSGSSLATIREDQFVRMDRAALAKMWTTEYPADAKAREAAVLADQMNAREKGEAGRPSVETLLHDLFPQKLILHVHPALVNGLTCGRDGEKIMKELFPDAIWIPSSDPGFVLALLCREKMEEYRRETGKVPNLLFLQNHGVFFAAQSGEEMDALVSSVMEKLGAQVKEEPDPAPAAFDASEAAEIAPLLRMLYSDKGSFVRFEASGLTARFCADAAAFAPIEGAFTPDHIVYCKAKPLFLPEALKEEEIIAAFRAFENENGYRPKTVFVQNLGMFSLGMTYKEAKTAQTVFEDAMKIAVYAESFGGYQPMTKEKIDFIVNWEVESYRSSVSLASGGSGARLSGKVAIVTGSAQGFGKGIAEALLGEGACVVIADMNLEGAQAVAKEFTDRFGEGRAAAVGVNVAQEDSVMEMVRTTVLTYGGLDLFVSNAGIAKAGSLEEMTKSTFELVASVNYTAFFLCAKYASRVMKAQNRICPTYTADIVQVNSKSGLEGSNKNFAYAGSKFGGIGLVQSFALELCPYGIKVNAVCPGNYLDGPLWSDPVRGLFVQYLNAGKVPGAKTVEDVRRYYMAKVPMNRGCLPLDVARAIFYLVEQQYETGQALPVTGGQVMLK